MTKRVCDVMIALLGLLVSWPVWLVAGVLIKLDSSGPIFFRQTRIGRGLRPFGIYKFRTMVQDAATKGSSITIGEDTRVTRVGRVLRKTKLDELPQLLNILIGDMSVVGPRPEVPRYVELFRSEFSEILSVRPGLTDLASLKYIDEATILRQAPHPEAEYRRTILPEKINLAKLYVRHASLMLDLAIIVQTSLRLFGIPLVVCELPGLQPAVDGTSFNYGKHLKARLLKWRRPLIVLLDIGLIILANYSAFWLRFDGAIPDVEQARILQTMPWLIAIRIAAFIVFRLNEGLWRYVSIWDLQNIVSGVITGTIIFYGAVRWGMAMPEYPRSVFIIDSILLIGLVTGIRLPCRLLREQVIYRYKTKVLIVGAGDTGERIVREMRTRSSYRYQPIGFVDDKASLRDQRIHGVKVLGTLKDIAKIIAEQRPEEVVVALPGATPSLLRQIIAELELFKVSIKTLPGVKDLSADKSAISQIRSVSLGDLLPRAPVHLETTALRDMLSGKCVLITGAGGSIGSELARQISLLRPQALVLYERHENSLYTIAKQLDDSGYSEAVRPVIGDVTDVRRLSLVMSQYRPSILFHAAAHKHVPLVEMNVAEALKNNCMGTRIVAEAAHKFEVERFVLVSTDKAVNPSSVMGATKRVAELIVQEIARRSATRFLTVRFGNVLGSSGSVLLRFQEQIQNGGPVTVTHPAIRRYFMLIPEAVHLVLQAAALGQQKAIYILDMGEQIRVLDLARNLIRLSGFVPGQDIPIRIIGLRPGEKLHEELVGEGELTEASGVEKILRIKSRLPLDLSVFQEKELVLEAAAHMDNTAWALEQLHELVPTFRPSDNANGFNECANFELSDQEVMKFS
jgi:FlaA1/EpsC-like NDP-sugar epimerase/lipopolysaccharide/colanic/teichoic acid biosynthesis glycosyltransferase